jgi:hypothetical protein
VRIDVRWYRHVAVDIPFVDAPGTDVVVRVAVVALAVVAGGAKRALSAGHSGKARIALGVSVALFSGNERRLNHREVRRGWKSLRGVLSNRLGAGDPRRIRIPMRLKMEPGVQDIRGVREGSLSLGGKS